MTIFYLGRWSYCLVRNPHYLQEQYDRSVSLNSWFAHLSRKLSCAFLATKKSLVRGERDPIVVGKRLHQMELESISNMEGDRGKQELGSKYILSSSVARNFKSSGSVYLLFILYLISFINIKIYASI